MNAKHITTAILAIVLLTLRAFALTYEQAKEALLALDKLKTEKLVTDAEHTKRRQTIIDSIDGQKGTTPDHTTVLTSLASADAQPSNQSQQPPDQKKAEPITVTILGAIQKLGTYKAPFPISVAQLVGFAGGFTDAANKARIGVRSHDKITWVSLSPNVKPHALQSGDVITVSRADDRR